MRILLIFREDVGLGIEERTVFAGLFDQSQGDVDIVHTSLFRPWPRDWGLASQPSFWGEVCGPCVADATRSTGARASREYFRVGLEDCPE